jgi:uncharacterized protein (TIGR02145 family)
MFSLAATSQSPQKISYQAVVRNNADNLVKEQTIGMKISILNGTNAVYIETQTPMTNINGLVSIEIGMGTVVNGTFTSIDWSSGSHFIKTETDLDGSNNYTITGTSQLLSVPYALHAKTAENISGVANLATTTALEALQAKVDAIELNTGNSTMSDNEGNVYKIVKIGEQVWMAENMKATSGNSGAFSKIVDSQSWIDNSDNNLVYAFYDFSSSPSNNNGALYNHLAALQVCPNGWRLPSYNDFSTLVTFLNNNGYSNNGYFALKSRINWINEEYKGENTFGFNSLPSGYVIGASGASLSIGEATAFWLSTNEGAALTSLANFVSMFQDSNEIANEVSKSLFLPAIL